MKTITLRKLPPEVSGAIEKTARENGFSLNRAAIRLMEKALGKGPAAKKPVVQHDLDFLFGSMTKEDAKKFDASLKWQRRIEPEMWK
jgi:hypothetical protein